MELGEQCWINAIQRGHRRSTEKKRERACGSAPSGRSARYVASQQNTATGSQNGLGQCSCWKRRATQAGQSRPRCSLALAAGGGRAGGFPMCPVPLARATAGSAPPGRAGWVLERGSCCRQPVYAWLCQRRGVWGLAVYHEVCVYCGQVLPLPHEARLQGRAGRGRAGRAGGTACVHSATMGQGSREEGKRAANTLDARQSRAGGGGGMPSLSQTLIGLPCHTLTTAHLNVLPP